MSVQEKYQELLNKMFAKAGLKEVSEEDLEIGTYTNAQIVQKMQGDLLFLMSMLMQVAELGSPAVKRSTLSFAVDKLPDNESRWISKTKQFNSKELAVLETSTAEDISGSLLISDPVVVLRALAEVLLNGDIEKLSILLDNDQLTAHWMSFKEDFLVDYRDVTYAGLLNMLLDQ